MDDFINWFRQYIWEWAVGRAYDVIFFVVLPPSVIMIVVQVFTLAGAITTSANDSQYIKEVNSSAYAILYCIGIIGDIGTLFSLAAIATRLYRDIGRSFRR